MSEISEIFFIYIKGQGVISKSTVTIEFSINISTLEYIVSGSLIVQPALHTKLS